MAEYKEIKGDTKYEDGELNNKSYMQDTLSYAWVINFFLH